MLLEIGIGIAALFGLAGIAASDDEDDGSSYDEECARAERLAARRKGSVVNARHGNAAARRALPRRSRTLRASTGAIRRGYPPHRPRWRAAKRNSTNSPLSPMISMMC